MVKEEYWHFEYQKLNERASARYGSGYTDEAHNLERFRLYPVIITFIHL